jgi:hypothetical protein
VRALILSVALALAACSTNKANQLPAEAWSVDDYVKAGVPAPDHTWSPDEHEAALAALARETKGHRDRLPHKDGPKSGAVFARIAEQPAGPSPGADATQTFMVHGRRFEATNQISKLYTVDEWQTATPEFVALTGVMLREAAILMVAAPAFLATFPADDPTRPAREDGLAKMRSGWGTMLLGGLLLCADTRIAEPARISLARDLRTVFDGLYASAEPATQELIRKQLAQLHDKLSDGPLRQALPPKL